MRRWNVAFVVGFEREIEMVVDADAAKEALILAIMRLELEPEEFIHTAHIGRPLIIASQNDENA